MHEVLKQKFYVYEKIGPYIKLNNFNRYKYKSVIHISEIDFKQIY